MNEFEKLNSRVKYYLLDYKDTYMEKVQECFKTTRLRDFTRKQLKELLLIATAHDIENFD